MHRKLITRHICRLLMAIIIIMAGHTTAAYAEAIGTWRLYPSYNKMTKIEPAGDVIYVIASGSLYSYNTADNSITTYDHISTLNSKDITNMAWISQTRRLVIAYADYSIDLLDEKGETLFMTDIKDKELAGDKTIYSIYTEGRMAYLATGFGIVKIDTREGYIVDSYILNCKVNRCYTDTRYIYAMSETHGLLRAALTDNLLNPNVWTRVGDYEEEETSIYVADERHGCYWGPDAEGRLAAFTRADDGTYTQTAAGVCPDGPPTNDVWRLYQHNNRIYATAGLYSYQLYKQNAGMAYYYEDGIWKKVAEPAGTGYGYINANCMAFDPTEKNHFYVGAQSGVYEYRNDEFVAAYSTHNTPLRGIGGSDVQANALVTSMAYDKDNTLWVMNGWNNVPLISLDKQGTWTAHPHDNASFSNLYFVDQQGTFYSRRHNRIFFGNCHGQTAAVYRYDPSTDQLDDYREFTDQDNTLRHIDILHDLAEDNYGNIWLATQNGPYYIRQQNVMGDMGSIVKHKVPRNDGTNYADYLLDNIPIKRIIVDSNNRKWMGTRGSGLYLISADNNTEIHHFTTENSPLIDNNIYDLLIDNTTGRLWIATDKGICSYQSDATQTGDSMESDNITVYPNPVTPDHTGDVTIVGMTAGAQITITAASGAMVHQGTSAGGSYTWNTKDTKGRYVASGVYMVLMTYADGSKGPTAKIAIVR
ncbi:MAG: T9SS type A sorting domain-containing protein [Bacteroidales bacterium]|nr:T9SS type A sorting domain-containing protein [Bacteroidales bacterium]MDY5448434.1 T9SS type A sorting domain-containing protein [Prevotella sp.]